MATGPSIAASAWLEPATDLDGNGADQEFGDPIGTAPDQEYFPVSLYPASTRHDLALQVLVAAVFVGGALAFTTDRGQRVLWTVVAANGVTLAFFGIAQQLTWNGKIFWRVPIEAGSPFASFVNRNNAAGFLNICLAGCIVACVLSASHGESARGDRTSGGGPWRPVTFAGRARAIWNRGLLLLANTHAGVLFATAGAIVIVMGILSSLSRGAWVALACATVVTLVARRISRPSHKSPMGLWIGGAVLLVASLGLVIWIGRGEAVEKRVSTLLNPHQTLSNERLTHWRDALATGAEFWRAGTGVGVYRYAYKIYRNRPDDVLYYHAENQYIEALVELGWLGPTMMLLAILLIAGACWRLLCEPSRSADYAFGIGGVFALSSQVVHACFDFGMAIPSNATLFALLCGALTGRAAYLTASSHRQMLSPIRRWMNRCLALPSHPALTGSIVTILICSVAAGAIENRWDAIANTARKSSPIPKTPQQASLTELTSTIQRLEQVAARRPDDAELQLHMAQLWYHRYRLQAIGQTRYEDRSPADQRSLWMGTEAIQVHAWVHQLARTNRTVELEDFRASKPVRENLPMAVRCLLSARRSCPLLPHVQLALAELVVAASDDRDERPYLVSAIRLSSADPDALFYCGSLALQAGHAELTCESWRRLLDLSPGQLGKVLELAAQNSELADNIANLLPDTPEILLQAAAELAEDEAKRAMRDEVLEKVAALARADHLPPEERYFLLGSTHAIRQENRQAVEYLSKAVELKPGKLPWRQQLATSLRAAGRIPEARKQAVTCARMAPGNDDYQALLRDLIRDELTMRNRTDIQP